MRDLFEIAAAYLLILVVIWSPHATQHWLYWVGFAFIIGSSLLRRDLLARSGLGLRGLLPPAVSEPPQQQARAYQNFLAAGGTVGQYLFLAALHDLRDRLAQRLAAARRRQTWPPRQGRQPEW